MVLLICYEFYLIGSYTYKDIQTNTYMDSLESQNAHIQKNIEQKEDKRRNISTLAYQIRIAKATQNKKLPGEEVINIVTSEDVASNADIDINRQISTAKKKEESPTKNMSNPQKWWYYLSKGGI